MLADDRRRGRRAPPSSRRSSPRTHPRRRAEAPRPRRHRRRPARWAVQDMRTALTAGPARSRDDDDHGLRARARGRRAASMGERLALAVEVSDRAPAESLRYASFLMQDNRPGPAEGVRRRRAAPRPREPRAPDHARPHPPRAPDWARAGQVAGILRARADPVATAMADEPRRRPLARRGQAGGRRGDARDPGSAACGDGRRMARPSPTSSAPASPPASRRRPAAPSTAALAGDPASPPARFLLAGLDAIEGRNAAAEARLPDARRRGPCPSRAAPALFRLLAGAGRLAEADAALEQGIAAPATRTATSSSPRGPARVARRPRRRDRRLRDALAARATAPVLANNLASLL